MDILVGVLTGLVILLGALMFIFGLMEEESKTVALGSILLVYGILNCIVLTDLYEKSDRLRKIEATGKVNKELKEIELSITQPVKDTTFLKQSDTSTLILITTKKP